MVPAVAFTLLQRMDGGKGGGEVVDEVDNSYFSYRNINGFPRI